MVSQGPQTWVLEIAGGFLPHPPKEALNGFQEGKRHDQWVLERSKDGLALDGSRGQAGRQQVAQDFTLTRPGLCTRLGR